MHEAARVKLTVVDAKSYIQRSSPNSKAWRCLVNIQGPGMGREVHEKVAKELMEHAQSPAISKLSLEAAKTKLKALRDKIIAGK